MMTMAFQIPHGLDDGLDREVENLRAALFNAQCAKSADRLTPEDEDRCRKAVEEVAAAHREFEVVNKVYVARARMAAVPTIRLALLLATNDYEQEGDPERKAARLLLCEQTSSLFAQRMNTLNASVHDAHATDIARFKAVVSRAARSIDAAAKERVTA